MKNTVRHDMMHAVYPHRYDRLGAHQYAESKPRDDDDAPPWSAGQPRLRPRSLQVHGPIIVRTAQTFAKCSERTVFRSDSAKCGRKPSQDKSSGSGQQPCGGVCSQNRKLLTQTISAADPNQNILADDEKFHGQLAITVQPLLRSNPEICRMKRGNACPREETMPVAVANFVSMLSSVAEENRFADTMYRILGRAGRVVLAAWVFCRWGSRRATGDFIQRPR